MPSGEILVGKFTDWVRAMQSQKYFAAMPWLVEELIGMLTVEITAYEKGGEKVGMGGYMKVHVGREGDGNRIILVRGRYS